ncbi:beta-1,3-galactosyltransferase 2-like [Bombina bombina]|uniref:beta-1,3-galactosyltransferase 2-like n=1 Tax=Bombina bombina TaxID=8345 RepID=UPI00235B0DAB|nr:beta-1,3-galactosyltransferase 2-like [Bombina bombina]
MALQKLVPSTFRKRLKRVFIFVFILLSIFTLCLIYFQFNLKVRDGQIKISDLISMRELYRWGLLKENSTEEVILNTPGFSPAPKVELCVGCIDIRLFPYLINEPDKCKEKTPFLFLLIATEAKDLEKRNAIRNTWAHEVSDEGIPIGRLFMLGTNAAFSQSIIQEESDTYHDIIQKEFQDTYRNLTIKVLMGMEWITNHCPGAKYTMKTDTDMFVNTEHILQILKPNETAKPNFFTGLLMRNGNPHRDKSSKWYVSYSEYPDNKYADFCSGTGYLFSTDLAPKIIRSSIHIRYLSLEDVFVGLCLRREGVALTTPEKNYWFNIHRVHFHPCTYRNLITSHGVGPKELIEYWNAVKNHKGQC